MVALMGGGSGRGAALIMSDFLCLFSSCRRCSATWAEERAPLSLLLFQPSIMVSIKRRRVKNRWRNWRAHNSLRSVQVKHQMGSNMRSSPCVGIRDDMCKLCGNSVWLTFKSGDELNFTKHKHFTTSSSACLYRVPVNYVVEGGTE